MLKLKLRLHISKETVQKKEKPPEKDGLLSKFKNGVCYGVGHSVGLLLFSKLPLDHIFELVSSMF